MHPALQHLTFYADCLCDRWFLCGVIDHQASGFSCVCGVILCCLFFHLQRTLSGLREKGSGALGAGLGACQAVDSATMPENILSLRFYVISTHRYVRVSIVNFLSFLLISALFWLLFYGFAFVSSDFCLVLVVYFVKVLLFFCG